MAKAIEVSELLYDDTQGIPVDAKDFPVLVLLNGKSGALKEKTTKDGQALYAVKGAVMKETRDGELGAAFGVTVQTLEPLNVKLRVSTANYYKAVGTVRVRTWMINGSGGTTLTVDKLVPLTAAELEALENAYDAPEAEEEETYEPVDSFIN